MLCDDKCPKGLNDCNPLSNVVSDNKKSLVCVGLHDNKDNHRDKFRHCFKNVETDSVYEYDDYDLKSVISVMAEALLIDELEK